MWGPSTAPFSRLRKHFYAGDDRLNFTPCLVVTVGDSPRGSRSRWGLNSTRQYKLNKMLLIVCRLIVIAHEE